MAMSSIDVAAGPRNQKLAGHEGKEQVAGERLNYKKREGGQRGRRGCGVEEAGGEREEGVAARPQRRRTGGGVRDLVSRGRAAEGAVLTDVNHAHVDAAYSRRAFFADRNGTHSEITKI
ncbi:hypothetical protein MUK42_35065 [Musa troglodytarum]|uniref:Uncharacterized protein n=1 Tax=Musa troglodytarum TaxID=320322 RepID=A0A9E7FCV4_9LILI|nr:hypothetical protein MUK42_35065 [Musa troglodytarum]